VKSGLPADAAIRALTIDAATLAGAADRLGTLEKGKIANIIETDGDVFDEKTTIKHVFIDGRPVPLDVSAGRPGGERRRPSVAAPMTSEHTETLESRGMARQVPVEAR
jgi:hypothetical protein